MQHTYLRYECGDSFGLITSSSSSKAPQSNSIIKCVQPSSGSSSSESSIILTTAGSHCLGYHLRTTSPTIKIGHREKLSGGVGTGRALNSDHIVCIDVASPSTTLSHDYNDDKDDGRMHKVATGWVDGAVRVFDVTSDELCGLGSHQGNIISKKGCGLVQSLLSPDDDDDVENEFIMRDPLVLNGHSGSPVRAISFEKAYQHLITGTPIAASRLASGANDGSVVLWDIVAETGLFRLLGHRGGITDLNFVSMGSPLSLSSTSSVSLDLLVSSSLDGLVKIWDLQGQCCIQTIATHMGEVWAASCVSIPDVNYAKRLGGDNAGGDNVADNDGGEKDKQSLDHRIRLVTGSSDGQTRVWSIEPSKRSTLLSTSLNKTEASVIMTQTDIGKSSFDKQAIVEDDHGAVASTTSATTAVIAEDNLDDVCHYMGTLSAPPNVATSADRIACLHFHPNGKYVGVLHANSKNVDIYLIRSTKEALRKKRRRLKRRKEKSKGEKDDNDKFTNKTKTSQKRGILDDPESDDDQQMEKMTLDNSLAAMERTMDPEKLKASDEFEYFGTVRGTHKIKGFVFVAGKIAGGGVKVVCALATNAMETHVLKKESTEKGSFVASVKISTANMAGHPTGIRGIELSSDDNLACTVSKNTTKIWNMAKRSCIQSLSPSLNGNSCYGLCVSFLPENTHVVIGTREGHLLIVDIAAGDVVYTEENAHDGAIWSIDIRRPTAQQTMVSIVTGSADKTVKFWDVEAQDDDATPLFSHARTLEMSDDVVAVRYSHCTDPSKRLVFVSTLDSTIKVFFDDTLKFFLSLYGHKLPALAIDASDDDTILASSGADKTVKIWGLDFGDTHRTLHGHEDSVTDLRFVRRTHNFFTSSKDGTVRYWDGDRFEQILILNGHFAEVSCLAVSRTGAFVASAGMDRQIRVWERTNDMVFLEEERERELEQMFDGVSREEEATGRLLSKKTNAGDDDGDDDDDDKEGDDNEPQSEAAVKRSVLSVAAGDRIMEGLERVEQETKDAATFRKKNPGKKRMPNPLMLGMEPAHYLLWILKSVKQAELEQSLLVLPLGHVERLLYYLILLLKEGRGIEICARVSIFMVKTHQNQIMASRSTAVPLRELRRLLRQRLAESRDTIGFNLAALRAVAKTAADRKGSYLDYDAAATTKDIWAGMGLGSDLAAALESRRK